MEDFRRPDDGRKWEIICREKRLVVRAYVLQGMDRTAREIAEFQQGLAVRTVEKVNSILLRQGFMSNGKRTYCRDVHGRRNFASERQTRILHRAALESCGPRRESCGDESSLVLRPTTKQDKQDTPPPAKSAGARAPSADSSNRKGKVNPKVNTHVNVNSQPALREGQPETPQQTPDDVFLKAFDVLAQITEPIEAADLVMWIAYRAIVATQRGTGSLPRSVAYYTRSAVNLKRQHPDYYAARFLEEAETRLLKVCPTAKPLIEKIISSEIYQEELAALQGFHTQKDRDTAVALAAGAGPELVRIPKKTNFERAAETTANAIQTILGVTVDKPKPIVMPTLKPAAVALRQPEKWVSCPDCGVLVLDWVLEDLIHAKACAARKP
jgi:hypothetical protein